MANHGWIKSRKIIQPELISTILDEMNEKLFKGNLVIEYVESTAESLSWGDHTWILRYVSEGKEWATRVCWLETPKKFKMRHGGGSKFSWWLDTAILNEVAVRFNGTIHDDGIEEKIKGSPNKYDTFKDYLRYNPVCIPYVVKNSKLTEMLLTMEKEITPKEFFDQL